MPGRIPLARGGKGNLQAVALPQCMCRALIFKHLFATKNPQFSHSHLREAKFHCGILGASACQSKPLASQALNRGGLIRSIGAGRGFRSIAKLRFDGALG